MEANKEIRLKVKELNKIRRQIKRNKFYALQLSQEGPENDGYGNPFQDEVEFLKLQEMQVLQEIQYLKRQIQNSVHRSFLSKASEETG